ncbi:MAG: hypothetical protein ACI4Q3_05545 [Kiritimatiellia bacterium]
MTKSISAVAAAICALGLQARIAVDAPGHVYTEKETPSARGGSAGRPWQLADWLGNVRESGVWAADGTAVFKAPGVGYYHVKSGAEDATFAVVPVPESRVFDHASFYGIDSAQSWVSSKGSFDCPWYGGDTYRLVSDLLWRTGLPHVRERLCWAEVNPQPDAWEWGRYMYNADMLRQRGILVSGMFHDAPKRADVIAKLPRDLVEVYRFCARAAAAFGERMGNWEFWNEQDISFAPEPAWDYTAAMKAAYLGFKAGRPQTVVLPGALCMALRSAYDRGLFANDLAKYSQVFNFHTYSPIASYPAIFGELRAFMKEVGIGKRAIWMTESGTNLEGSAMADGAHRGKKAHTPEQELIQAEFYAKSQIAFQMQGVSRNYFFVFGAYNERGGAKDWGVMRRDGTVKPVYAAISTMTRELVSARLAGEIAVGDGLKAYLFNQPDGSQTLAFWSVSSVDTSRDGAQAAPLGERTLELAAADGVYRQTDLCGAARAVTARNGKLVLSATRYTAYVSGLKGLAADIAPVPEGAVETYAPAADEDLAVILRADLDPADFAIAGGKSTAELKGDAGRLRLQVWNLSATAKRGRLDVRGAALDGLPDALDLPAWGKAEIDATLRARDGKTCRSTAVVTGVFNGKRTSRLAIPVRFERNFLANCVKIPLRCQDPKDWKRNTSAADFKASWDAAEQALRFDVSWKKNPDADRWFYPVYDLKLPAESLDGAAAFEFEVKSRQDKVENDFRTQNLMLVYPKGSGLCDRFLAYGAPLTQWETRRVELGTFGESSVPVQSIRLGANPAGLACTFWIRNLRILKIRRDQTSGDGPAQPAN